MSFYWWLLAPILGVLLFLSLGLYTWLRRDDGADLPPPEFLNVAGQRVAVYRMGEKGRPQLVLLHGLGASAYGWRYLMDRLKSDFELIALDLVGFGNSSRPADSDYSLDTQSQWLHQTIQALGLRPLALVGSSMGGLLSLWLSKLHPQVYPRVIALSPAALGKRARPAASFWYFGERLLPVFVNRWTMPWIVLGVVGSLHPLNRKSLHRYLHSTAVRPFLLAHKALCDARLPGALGGLKTEVLILWGRFDLMVPRQVLRDLKTVLPGAKMVTLNSAHLPHEHQPEVVAGEIRAWLKSRS